MPTRRAKIAAPGSPDNLFLREGVWWARFQVNGRDIKRSLRTASRAEARRRLGPLLDRAEVERAAHLLPDGPKVWEDAVQRWEALHASQIKPSSLKRYVVSLRQVDPHFAGAPVGSIDGPAIARFVAARKAGGASDPTVRRDLAIVSRVIKAARRAGWTTHDPVPDEKAELKESRRAVRRLRTRRIAAAIRAARTSMTPDDRPHLPDLLRLIARTGAREDEASRVAWSDFDFPARTLAFRGGKTDADENAGRVVVLPERAARWLASLPRAPKPNAGPWYIFQDRGGGHLKQVAQRFARVVERHRGAWWTEPRWTVHHLRHTYAMARLLADDRPGRRDHQPRGIHALSLHLGHASVKTTEIYLKGYRLPPI